MPVLTWPDAATPTEERWPDDLWAIMPARAADDEDADVDGGDDEVDDDEEDDDLDDDEDEDDDEDDDEEPAV
jgi:hypothetical protein